MKPGARMALGVGAGYLLGRTKKMRLALMIAAAGASGRMNTSPRALLQNGLKQLGSSAELGKLTDIARDELVSAAKAAAVTAASNRIESLNTRLQEGGRTSGKESGEEPDEDRYDEDEADSEAVDQTGNGQEHEGGQEPEDDEEEQAPPRRRASGRRSPASSGNGEPARRSRSTTSRAPVRRARR